MDPQWAISLCAFSTFLGTLAIEMKKLALAIFLTLLALPAWATTYYLAPASGGGSESNDGKSAITPWLTPNHPVNCGDVILATAGTYSELNFTFNDWGTVTCAAGNNVAWLKCATFDACKISITTGLGLNIDESYWGVQGWEVDGTSATSNCFSFYANHGTEIHHLIFANDIAIGCGLGGFGAGPNGTVGQDYVAYVGDIAYGTSGGSAECTSAFNVYEPIASDSLPGTHYYMGGDFAWDNVNGNPCNGGMPTDGEGMFFDTSDGSQTGLPSYTQQMVMDNSIVFLNGGRGAFVFQNVVGPPNAHIYIRNITAWGNNKDPNQNCSNCAEISSFAANNVEIFKSIGVTNAAEGRESRAIYGLSVIIDKLGNHVYDSVAYSASGNYTTDGGQGFTFGPNIFNANPTLSNPGDPGAPNCNGFASVPACMATVIANFAPTTAEAKAYGYQKPLTVNVYDPLFPQWLCNVNLPAGLVTMGCLSASSLPPVVNITSITVK
jgi:hypothetical protein